MNVKWFAPHVAYTMAKFNMSIIALGLSGELKGAGIAANTLWPRTTIATAAVRNLLGGDELMRRSRTPEIMGDAAHIILTKDANTFTGNFCIDDTLLSEHGVTDFEKYRVDKSVDLAPDFFVPDSYKAPPGVKLADRMR
jgi:citronellol/citronellal dehydrogenase